MPHRPVNKSVTIPIGRREDFKVIWSYSGKVLLTLVQRKPLLPVLFCQCSQAIRILPMTDDLSQVFLRVDGGPIKDAMPGSVRSIPMPAGCGCMSERSSMWVVCGCTINLCKAASSEVFCQGPKILINVRRISIWTNDTRVRV